jgi:hypothetical protein
MDYYQDLIDERDRLMNLIEYAKDNNEEAPDTFYHQLKTINDEIKRLEEL